MRGPQRRGPALAQVLEIGLARLDPVGELRRAGVAPHHQQIERHADAEVRAHGGVDRDQADLERVIEIGLERDRAVEHRLAVFVLADLEVGRVDGAFDEIAGRIDHEEPRPLALDLAAEQKRQVELDVGGLERDLVGPVDAADGAPDALRRLEHGRGVEQGFALAGLGILEALMQGAEHRLGEREVAGGGDRENPLARDREGVQLAEDRDVVEPRIGARVGDHDDAVANEDSTAIGHGACTDSPDRAYSYASEWRIANGNSIRYSPFAIRCSLFANQLNSASAAAPDRSPRSPPGSRRPHRSGCRAPAPRRDSRGPPRRGHGRRWRRSRWRDRTPPSRSSE